MNELTPDQIRYVLEFQHPEKALAALPGVRTETIAALFDIPVADYCKIRDSFATHARQAAESLLADPEVATLVDRLPFQPGQTIVGLGDSITDDDPSWVSGPDADGTKSARLT